MTAKKFYGKYRGKVENNTDPMFQGRVQVSCAPVLGTGTNSWAMPCSPSGGSGVGFFAVPPVGADVWVEFEGGDPNSPILAGCFWAIGDVPAQPALASTKIWKTDNITLKLDDLPGAGGVTLEVASPSVAMPISIKCTSSGIEISMGNSSIKLDGVKVSVNSGALEVM